MSEEIETLQGHVVVAGSGLAGLMTALSLAPMPVVLVTRGELGGETSSAWAQGGIAAALGADDSPELHLADTLSAGAGLCDRDIAAGIVAEARDTISALESFGVHFDRADVGSLSLGLEAAHSRHRIVHAGGDGSGEAIVGALVRAIRKTPSISVLAGFEVRRLLLTDKGVIGGVLCGDPSGLSVIRSSHVVLATGGLGGLYEASTNPAGNWGQGIMLAARAGARLADMEFVQFHPTALDTPSRPLSLISEAVRGEGALLVNERGERFMADVPDAELAPRDVVARAINAQIARGGRAFLDARQAPGKGFKGRFPGIAATCAKAGIDPSADLIPVRPAVHYHMGGVATDAAGRSSVNGLWVVGEAACTGLHGANRLASNSLLEAAVLGRRAAADIAGRDAVCAALPDLDISPIAADPSRIRSAISRYLGLRRSETGIRSALSALLAEMGRQSPAADPAIVGLLIAAFANERRESRGAHARMDFPLPAGNSQRRFMTLSDAISIARNCVDTRLIRSA